MDNQLYKFRYSLPLFKCLTPENGDNVLCEIQDRIYENDFRGRAIVYETIIRGCFWLIMQQDALELAKKCDNCQRFTLHPSNL